MYVLITARVHTEYRRTPMQAYDFGSGRGFNVNNDQWRPVNSKTPEYTCTIMSSFQELRAFDRERTLPVTDRRLFPAFYGGPRRLDSVRLKNHGQVSICLGVRCQC